MLLQWAVSEVLLCECHGRLAYLTSLKVEGRSTVIAPPKRGVDLEVAIAGF